MSQTHPLKPVFAAPRPTNNDHCADCRLRRMCLVPQETDQPVLPIAYRKRVARNAHLYQPGTPTGGHLFVVRFGSFKTYDGDPGGHVNGFPMSADLIGIDDLGQARHAGGASAVEDSEVCVLDVGAAPAAYPQLHRMYSRQMASVQHTGLLLRYTGSEQRLAAFLLRLGQRYAELGFSQERFNLPMSRHDLADFLNLTPESVSRRFLQFKHDGVLSIRGRAVHMLDQTALQQAASGERLVPPTLFDPSAHD